MQDLAHYLRPGTLQLPALPPLSLYVHLPWCIRKCPYCDFNSHEIAADQAPQQAYPDALLADLDQALPLIWGRPVHSIFIGGGTPSLFSPAAIDQLLSGLRARLRQAHAHLPRQGLRRLRQRPLQRAPELGGGRGRRREGGLLFM